MPKEFHEFDMTKPPGASWGIRIGGGVDRGKVLVLEKVSLNFSMVKSEEKKTAHFQKLAINKKSTFFVLSS